MSNNTKPLVAGRTPEWHFDRFIEFTRYKLEIGEPSPHLAIMGYLIRDMATEDKVFSLGCYAATYCLPSAQLIWTLYPLEKMRADGRSVLESWLTEHWPGIVTRTERRCVRSPAKMAECLSSLVHWIDVEFPQLGELPKELSRANYDIVWESADKIKYFGRYINIRFIEGLRRYCDVPALLYDIRSVGGWSPKRALGYLYPEHAETLLIDDAIGNELTNNLAMQLLKEVQSELPAVNEYILAAMLCEYKSAYENRKQFVGHTIDQEPALYNKAFQHWGSSIDRNLLWEARKALFPKEVLGELSGWQDYRHPLAKVLRDHGYVWSDLIYSYTETTDLANPVRRQVRMER